MADRGSWIGSCGPLRELCENSAGTPQECRAGTSPTTASGPRLDRAWSSPRRPAGRSNGNPIRSGGLPAFAAGPNNTLYAVWEDDHPTPGVDAIQFSQSTNGGLTWSQPIKINKTPTGIPAEDQQAFTPEIKVASNGTIGVTYYDLRNNTPAPGLPTDYWFVHCHSSCTDAANWSETHVAGPFDEEQAAVAGGYFLGDYQGMDTIGNSFVTAFDQAIFQATDPSDVYFARITPSP